MNFVDYWIDMKWFVEQTLVFDSKLTTYEILEELDADGIKFITLRRRGKKLIEDEIIIKMKKKATTPIFKSNDVFQKSYPIPWLGNKTLRFDWVS